MNTLDPPVSVLLALWAPTPSSRGAAVVEGKGGAHLVADDVSPWGVGRLRLDKWLPSFGNLGRAGAVLVSPADPLPALAVALDAGEAVVLEARHGRRVLLVPRSLGGSVTWQVEDLDVQVPPHDPSQARRDVHAATEEAIDVLVELDLARERPELADTLSDLVTAVLDQRIAPPNLDSRRRILLERSLRLEAICSLALQDDGAAANAFQAARREAVLRPLMGVARNGVAAATEWWHH